jgi:adenine-specific DNA-methyltransferase
VAAIDDLIAQIEDKALRERLRLEIDRITKEKKFGLVFEDHLPELTPIYSAKVGKNSKVALRNGPLADLWRVQAIRDGEAHCRNITRGDTQQFPVDDLVVVRQFGEPIFPALVPVARVQNGPDDTPWHTLIEADNYHALQLLEYLYAGQIDCIYIDPPYNTGDKSWKYNNDYVDSNDYWRHSKWLSMMKKRLLLAKKLLHPREGVLIVTIDEHEIHHLRVLLEQLLPQYYIQMITAVTNPKGVTQGRFSRVEEYVIYCFAADAYVADSDDNLLNPPAPKRKPRWKGLLRSGTNARRVDRKNMFYPVLIDEGRNAVVGAGDSLPFEEAPIVGKKIDGFAAAWPIRTDGSFGNWGVGYVTLRKLIVQGYVSCGKYDEKRKTYGLSYISEPNQKLIETGGIVITGRDPVTNVVSIEYASDKNRAVKTVWHRTRHDAGAYGSDFLGNVLGRTASFSFPKSIYSEKDAIGAVVRNNKNALILDFFAGSGTTLNAVNLLNENDNGKRRCIMVTNNEVSAEEAALFTEKGLRAGDSEWEGHGICQSVTWPRSKFTILGKRDAGSDIEGEYFTGKSIEGKKPRKFQQIGFTTIDDLKTAAKKKQLVSLLDSIPQSEVKKDSDFIVSEKLSASILFDESRVDTWLDALEDQDHITDFYIVTARKTTFENIKSRIIDLLGPMIVSEEEKRPLKEGFPVNLEYFRLDFLDKDNVALGRQFREILPILWLRAGAIGPRPEPPKNKSIPAMLIPEKNTFAVLVDETRFADFAVKVKSRANLTHVYLVTDSEEAFQEMAGQLDVPNVFQLYRDYLENFVINKGGYVQ